MIESTDRFSAVHVAHGPPPLPRQQPSPRLLDIHVNHAAILKMDVQFSGVPCNFFSAKILDGATRRQRQAGAAPAISEWHMDEFD